MAPTLYTESVLPTPRIDPSAQAPLSPARQRQASAPGTELDEAAVEASLRARILAFVDDQDSAAAPSSMDESPDANASYASLKLQMSEIQRAQGASKRAQKAKAKGQPTVSQVDFFFPECSLRSSVLNRSVLQSQAELMEAQVTLLKKKLKVIEGDYTFRKPDAGSPA